VGEEDGEDSRLDDGLLEVVPLLGVGGVAVAHALQVLRVHMYVSGLWSG